MDDHIHVSTTGGSPHYKFSNIICTFNCNQLAWTHACESISQVCPTSFVHAILQPHAQTSAYPPHACMPMVMLINPPRLATHAPPGHSKSRPPSKWWAKVTRVASPEVCVLYSCSSNRFRSLKRVPNNSSQRYKILGRERNQMIAWCFWNRLWLSGPWNQIAKAEWVSSWFQWCHEDHSEDIHRNWDCKAHEGWFGSGSMFVRRWRRARLRSFKFNNF